MINKIKYLLINKDKRILIKIIDNLLPSKLIEKFYIIKIQDMGELSE